MAESKTPVETNLAVASKDAKDVPATVQLTDSDSEALTSQTPAPTLATTAMDGSTAFVGKISSGRLSNASGGSGATSHEYLSGHLSDNNLNSDFGGLNALPSIASIEDQYINHSKKYQCRIDAGVFVTVRNQLPNYTPSIELNDNDLLSICQLFEKLSYLRVLNLSDCSITCNGAYLLMSLLKKNTNIEVLELRNNKIGDLGALALSEVLAFDRTQLKILGLHYNHVTEKGAIHLAQGLKQNTSLEELDLSHNSLGSYGARIIRTALMERSLLQSTPLALEAPTRSADDGDAAVTPSKMDAKSLGSLKKLTLKDEDTSPNTPKTANNVKIRDHSSSSYTGSNAASPTSGESSDVKQTRSNRLKQRRRQSSSKKSSRRNSRNQNLLDSKTSGSPGNEVVAGGDNDLDSGESGEVGHFGAAERFRSLLYVDSYIWSLPGRMDKVRRAFHERIRLELSGGKELISPWVSVENYRKMEEKLQVWINFEGNNLKEEVFNSITHGLGLLLSVLGGFILLQNAKYHSWRCYVSCAIYCFTLLFMYLASTLYHSFFAMPLVKRVFKVLDYSAIFLLIAGTYTPILVTGLAHSPFHSNVLFTFMWLCAMTGVTLTAWIDPDSPAWKMMTVLYVSMSYVFLIAIKPFVAIFEADALAWILVGGAFYTGGIYFLQRDEMNPILHSVWHMFVLAGSICHYIAILCYVVPMDAVEVEYVPLTWQALINGILMDFPVTQWVGDALEYMIQGTNETSAWIDQ